MPVGSGRTQKTPLPPINRVPAVADPAPAALPSVSGADAIKHSASDTTAPVSTVLENFAEQHA
ncbi:MAG: hypothetical protein R2932_50630 [Caldilineaceae bacterium]